MKLLSPKNGVELLTIEVPAAAIVDGIEIRGRTDKNQLLSFYGNYDSITLPNGDWEIIATTKDITKDQTKQLVERKERSENIVGYKDYREEDGFCFTPMSSFYSLLIANGCNPDNKIYAILKNLSPTTVNK